MSKQLFVSACSEPELRRWIEEQGYGLQIIRTTDIVAEPVSCHPDMFICRLGLGDAPVYSYFEQNSVCLSAEYPHDIAINAACTGKYFIHNLKYTDPGLLALADRYGMQPVNVRQGYAKCSTVIVDETSVITYDEGLGKACEKAGMSVLMVSPGHVLLPGYETGFIGGASGRVSDTVVFNGDLRQHPCFEEIVSFIEQRGLSVKWFERWPLTDIGSIV